MIASAALQLAASRFLFEQGAQTGDPATFKLASQLANDSRQNLLAAYEYATRAAKAKPKKGRPVWQQIVESSLQTVPECHDGSISPISAGPVIIGQEMESQTNRASGAGQ